MTGPSKRDIRRAIDALKRQRAPTEEADEVTVKWREAAPDERPTGLTYDADEETLTYDVWAAQRKCLDALESGTNDIVAFLAGYGSGKSITGARWLIAQAMAHPGSRFLAMGVDFKKARGTTFRILFEQLPGDRTHLRTSSFNGPEQSPIVADFNRRDHRLTLTNDATIQLGSGDDWRRFAGAEFGGVWLDEPSHYSADLHDLLEMVGARLRGVAGPKVQCWTLTGNGYNDAWEILEKRQDKTGDAIGLDIELVRVSTLENPYLDEATADRFERQYGDTQRAEQALHGEFAAAQGLVYSVFDRNTHVIPADVAADRVVDDWRVYGYDAGWNDPRVLLEIGKTSYEQLVVLEEFHERASHVEDAIDWLQADDKHGGPIYSEHEPEHVSKFRRAGFRAETATKDLDAGIAEVRKRLQADGNDKIEAQSGARQTIAGRIQSGGRPTNDGGTVEGRVGLLVADRCEHLVREFLGYKEDHVGSSEAEDHCLDALRYACMGVAEGGRRSIPGTF